jgi:hypothetical protein
LRSSRPGEQGTDWSIQVFEKAAAIVTGLTTVGAFLAALWRSMFRRSRLESVEVAQLQRLQLLVELDGKIGSDHYLRPEFERVRAAAATRAERRAENDTLWAWVAGMVIPFGTASLFLFGDTGDDFATGLAVTSAMLLLVGIVQWAVAWLLSKLIRDDSHRLVTSFLIGLPATIVVYGGVILWAASH